MRPSSGGESCTWWELNDLWQQPCGEHKELHTSVNKWEKRDSSLTSVLAKIVRTMKKFYFVFVSTKFFIARCTRINYGCLSVNGKKPLLRLLEPLFSLFFNFFFLFPDHRHLRDDGKTGRISWDSDVFMHSSRLLLVSRGRSKASITLICQWPLYLSHIPLSGRTFECGFWEVGCLRVLSLRTLPSSSTVQNGEINDVATWLSLSLSGGWRGTRSVGARESTNVGFQAFRSALRYSYIDCGWFYESRKFCFVCMSLKYYYISLFMLLRRLNLEWIFKFINL